MTLLRNNCYNTLLHRESEARARLLSNFIVYICLKMKIVCNFTAKTNVET